jgi:ubiquinone/menaquinone biosynthesis C-methylase UbiE
MRVMSAEPSDGLPAEALRHYDGQDEGARLTRGPGKLELARTQELLGRHLPSTPAVIQDVGAGPGRYSFWLAREGYTVHLVDAVPRHVEEARTRALSEPGPIPASFAVGDARALAAEDGSADAVLLLGPLYHLTERADRVQALREARRVVRPDGVVFAACISRFASTLDGLARGLIDDPEFVRIVERDLADGQHRNPGDHPDYFTTAYFHRPEEVGEELAEAGLEHVRTYAVEGTGWLLSDFDARWEDPLRRERLLEAVRCTEHEPALLGASAHLLGVGRRADG